MHLISRHSELYINVNIINKIKEVYFVIITTPRTGSNLLYYLLKNNNIIGGEKDSEPFHTKFLDDIKFKDLDLEKYIHTIFHEYVTISQEIKSSGFKVMLGQLQIILHRYNKANNTHLDIGDIFAIFPKNTKYIILSRNNKIWQSISLYKAQYTSQWLKIGTSSPKKDVPFDFFKIIKYIYQLTLDEKKIFRLLHNKSIPYLFLTYETFTQNKIGTIKKITDYLGIHSDEFTDSINLCIQKDQNSEKLYRQFWSLHLLPLYCVQKIYTLSRTHLKRFL